MVTQGYGRGQDNPGSATNDQGEKHRQDRTPGIGFVSAGQADAAKDDSPNSYDKGATKWNDHQRSNGTAGKTNDAKCRLKRLPGTAHEHQTHVQNRRVDENADCDEKRGKDQK